MKILFICKGNVGRSQMAEALFRKKWGSKHEAFSAGTAISGPEQPIGELLPGIQEMLDVMSEEGLDVSMYVRKQLMPEMVEQADTVIAIVEDEVVLPEYLSASQKLVRWNVEDPKGKDIETTRRIKNEIKALMDMLSL
jgi:arsenate reductase (thioredoxin)